MRFSGSRPVGRSLLLFFSMRPAGRSVGGERLGRFGFICVPSIDPKGFFDRYFEGISV
jgi:hypothetical protein